MNKYACQTGSSSQIGLTFFVCWPVGNNNFMTQTQTRTQTARTNYMCMYDCFLEILLRCMFYQVHFRTKACFLIFWNPTCSATSNAIAYIWNINHFTFCISTTGVSQEVSFAPQKTFPRLSPPKPRSQNSFIQCHANGWQRQHLHLFRSQ